MQVLDTPERIGSFGFVAGSERLIAAFASGIALYDADHGEGRMAGATGRHRAGHPLQ